MVAYSSTSNTKTGTAPDERLNMPSLLLCMIVTSHGVASRYVDESARLMVYMASAGVVTLATASSYVRILGLLSASFLLSMISTLAFDTSAPLAGARLADLTLVTGATMLVLRHRNHAVAVGLAVASATISCVLGFTPGLAKDGYDAVDAVVTLGAAAHMVETYWHLLTFREWADRARDVWRKVMAKL